MRKPQRTSIDGSSLSDDGKSVQDSLAIPSKSAAGKKPADGDMKPPPAPRQTTAMQSALNGTLKDGVGRALTDTPVSTAPNTAPSSPRMYV